MKIRTINTCFLAFLLVIATGRASGQMGDIGKFTAGGVDDAEKLMKAYLTPWANALGTSLSGGWYNTAKVHKPLGFDLTFTLNMGFVPSSDKTFDLTELGLSTSDFSANTAPTAAGKKETGPEIRYADGLLHYNTPKGTNLSFIPSPMIQAGIGIVKGTEIDGRFMPNVDIGNIGSFGLWGIGLKHDILQWFSFAEKLPVLNVSIQGGFTKLKYKKDLSFLPSQLNIDDAHVDVPPSITFDDQRLDLVLKSLTVNLLVSANLPVICFYGGIGIANTKTDLDLTGYYPIPTVDDVTTSPTFGELIVNEESVGEPDPISVKIENNEGSPTKPRLNIGFRLKLGVITIHCDYTKANYSNVTAGLGITFR